MQRMPSIICFGDSHTERACYASDKGFVADLRNHYEDRVKVVDLALSGGTTTQLREDFFVRKVLRYIIASSPPPPPLVIIFLGTNDSRILRGEDGPQVPLHEFEANMRWFVQQILDHPACRGETRILLISNPPMSLPTPAGEIMSEAEKSAHAQYLSRHTYASKTVEIGRELELTTDGRVAVLDLWSMLVKHVLDKHPGTNGNLVSGYDSKKAMDTCDAWPGSGLPNAKEIEHQIISDGIHLGPEGNNLLAVNVMTTIMQNWPELARNNFAVQ